jgi:hypothetical protein
MWRFSMLFKTVYIQFWLIMGLIFVTACTPREIEPDPKAEKKCQVENFERLLWKPKSALNGMKLPHDTRVIHPNQAVTMDYRAQRLNISIGVSGRIERVYCG